MSLLRAALVAAPDGGAWSLVERGGGANAVGRANADDRFRTTAVDEELDGAAIGPDGQAWFGGLERAIHRAGNDGRSGAWTQISLGDDGPRHSPPTRPAACGSRPATPSGTSTPPVPSSGCAAGCGSPSASRRGSRSSWLRRIARELAAGREPLLDITFTATDPDGNTTDSLPRAYRVTR